MSLLAGGAARDSHQLVANPREIQSLDGVREVDCGIHGCERICREYKNKRVFYFVLVRSHETEEDPIDGVSAAGIFTIPQRVRRRRSKRSKGLSCRVTNESSGFGDGSVTVGFGTSGSFSDAALQVLYLT